MQKSGGSAHPPALGMYLESGGHPQTPGPLRGGKMLRRGRLRAETLRAQLLCTHPLATGSERARVARTIASGEPFVNQRAESEAGVAQSLLEKLSGSAHPPALENIGSGGHPQTPGPLRGGGMLGRGRLRAETLRGAPLCTPPRNTLLERGKPKALPGPRAEPWGQSPTFARALPCYQPSRRFRSGSLRTQGRRSTIASRPRIRPAPSAPRRTKSRM